MQRLDRGRDFQLLKAAAESMRLRDNLNAALECVHSGSSGPVCRNSFISDVDCIGRLCQCMPCFARLLLLVYTCQLRKCLRTSQLG